MTSAEVRETGTGTGLWSLDRVIQDSRWVPLCGPGNLFNTPRWLLVERAEVGPWVPRRHSFLVRTRADVLEAGLSVQLFDQQVDDETVRLDKMFPPGSGVAGRPAEELAAALQPSLLCGTWFNSAVLVTGDPGGEPARAARREVIEAATSLADDWGAAAIFFPFVDAEDQQLGAALAESGFLRYPAPARHVVSCAFDDFDAYLAALPSRRRRRIRNELQAVESAGLQTAQERLGPGNVERVAQLAHYLERKYEQRSSAEQMLAWFDAIARQTEVTVFTAGRPGQPPTAMSMWIHHQDRLYGFHAGFDYRHATGLPLYSLVGYHLPMRFGFEHPGVAWLEYGTGSDQAKLIRGTVARPQSLAVRPLTPRARAVLGEAR